MTITIKERIQRDLKPTCSEPVQGSNHVTRRHFRLWIKGSYLGDDHGKSNKKGSYCPDGKMGHLHWS